MFKNQILCRKSGFIASINKSSIIKLEDLIILGLGYSLVCHSPPETTLLHSWYILEYLRKKRPQPDAAGGDEGGGWSSQGVAASVRHNSWGPGCPMHCGCGCITHWLLLCAPDRRLYQDGTLKLLGRLSLLSEEILWAANGLPNPLCSSDHLCLLASFGMEITPLWWGSQGKSASLAEEFTGSEMVEIPILLETYIQETRLPLPRPRSLFPMVRCSPGLSMFSACGPCPTPSCS